MIQTARHRRALSGFLIVPSFLQGESAISLSVDLRRLSRGETDRPVRHRPLVQCRRW